MRRYFRRADELRRAPYAGLVAYPGSGGRAGAARAVESRLAEMGRLGITGVSFEGPTEIGGVRLLGRGHTGIVVLAARGRGRAAAALKMRRTDSPRASMAREARLLAAANRAGAGPRLLGHTRNLLAMEHLDGTTIERWIGGGEGCVGAAEAKAAARMVLEDCYRLDERGLDHGELSNIARHVVVVPQRGGVGGGGRTGGGIGIGACIVDFESASEGRRASNVTSAAQSMFIGSAVARGMAKAYAVPPRDEIIGALRAYKREGGPDSFRRLLGLLGLL